MATVKVLTTNPQITVGVIQKMEDTDQYPPDQGVMIALHLREYHLRSFAVRVSPEDHIEASLLNGYSQNLRNVIRLRRWQKLTSFKYVDPSGYISSYGKRILDLYKRCLKRIPDFEKSLSVMGLGAGIIDESVLIPLYRKASATVTWSPETVWPLTDRQSPVICQPDEFELDLNPSNRFDGTALESKRYFLYKNTLWSAGLRDSYADCSTTVDLQLLQSSGRTRSPRRHAIPESVRIFVWRRDGGACVRCGSREKLEYDHIIAVVNGGSNTARNIELLCQGCNRAKGSRIQ